MAYNLAGPGWSVGWLDRRSFDSEIPTGKRQGVGGVGWDEAGEGQSSASDASVQDTFEFQDELSIAKLLANGERPTK